MRLCFVVSWTWLAGLTLVLCLAVCPAPARSEDEAVPDVQTLQQELDQVREQMRVMQRQLEQLLQRQEECEARAPGEEVERAAEEMTDEDELEQLRRRAEEEVQPPEEELPTEKSFIARGLGLQALNPEMSVAGDLLLHYKDRKHENSDTDFEFRVLDIHLESYLDPFTKMKAALGFDSDDAHLGEAYFTRFGVFPGLNVTAGKFRQQFGVVNRWHKHALDQIDFPVALRGVFGGGGLNQTGISLDWAAPEVWGASQEVILQVTDGENSRVFGENSRHLPSILARYKNYRDLSKDTYLDIGITGLTGWNDDWETEHDTRQSWVMGADVTVRWEPTERMRYANLEWRSEFYYLDKGMIAPDGSGSDHIEAWGAYTSLQRLVSRTVELGIRADYFAPDSKSYADAATWGLNGIAVEGHGPYLWQVGPYVTWWQSPWVRLRLELDYADGQATGPSEFTCTGQAVFAAGPHKHERY
jgi:hypothetical protein